MQCFSEETINISGSKNIKRRFFLKIPKVFLMNFEKNYEVTPI